jgi:hypothetical protein
MKIEVNITRKDYGEFNQFYFLKKGIIARNKWLFIILFLFILFLRNIRNNLNIVSLVKDIFIDLVLLFIIYKLLIYVVVKIAEKTSIDNGAVVGKRTYTLTEEELIEESNVNRNHQKWSSILSFDENKNLIFLFIDNNVAYIIPKRDIKDKIEEELIKNYIRLKIKDTIS